MKKVLFFFMSLLNVATASADDTNYIINCAIGEEVEGKTVYLTNLDNTSIIDSAVVRNGRFHMEGKIEHPQVAVLSCKDVSLAQLLPFELFSKKFCLNISELGLELV